MPGMHDHHFTPGKLRSLLDAWGLDVGPDAVLAAVPEQSDGATPDELGRQGLLTQQWGVALRAITHPAAVLRVLQAMPDVVAVKSFLTDGTNPDLVGCWPEGDEIRIGFPYTAAGEVRDASALLMADFPAQTDPLRLDLTIDGLAGLSAAVDVLRGEALDSIVARRGATTPAITRAAMEHAYVAGLSSIDGRWLVTLLHMLMPLSIPLPEGLPDPGIAELVDHGLLTPEGHGWQAMAPLTQFASWLLNPLPAIAHEVVVLRNRETHAYRYVIALRGNGPVWTIEFWKEDPPMVTIRSRIGSGYRKVLSSILAPLEEAEPADEIPTPTAPATGESAATSQDLEERPVPSTLCPECNAPSRAGAAFCTSCGASLTD